MTHSVLGQGVIGTFTGTDFLFPAGPIPGLSAPLGEVQDVALDSAGNLYITDRDNHIVVQLSPNGGLVTYAGNGLSGFSGDSGAAVNASMVQPLGLAIDSSGNLYISDSANNRVRQVDATGKITTFAGTGNAGFTGNGVATSNDLNQPAGLATDAAGNLYIADSGNNLVRRVTPAGIMTTFAGNGHAASSGDGGPATEAGLNAPTAVKVDSSGNVYIATTDGVRMVTASTNKINTVLSGPSTGILPAGLALDSHGNLYVSNSLNNEVLQVAANGPPRVIAGNGMALFSGDAGPAVQASLNSPRGLAVSVSGILYIADRGNLRVRTVDLSSGIIATVAGNGNYSFSGDGSAAVGATFREPVSLAINPLDPAQSVFIADLLNNRIREVTRATVNTVAGDGAFGYRGDGNPATSAALKGPRGVAADNTGFYIADSGNNVVRKVNLQGIISTISGAGTQAGLRTPTALAANGSGDVYIADTSNGLIRELTPDMNLQTVAGGGSSTADGVSANSASLNAPQGVAVDSQGRIYISDTDDNLIRVVENGQISTVAGGGTALGENVAANSTFVNSPRGLAVDSAGNLYYAEFNANRVRRVSQGIVSTVAGVLGKAGFSGDGGLATDALLDGPQGLALDAAGDLFIADSNNNRVREVLAAPPAVQVSPLTLTFSGVAGGLHTDTQLVGIFSSNITGLPFTTSLLNNSPWLNIFPSAGSIPASLQVYADPSSLDPGSYPETIRIAMPHANPPFADVNVTFTVKAAGPPKNSVNPQSFSFAFVEKSSSKSQVLTITNLGGASLTFSIVATSGPTNWLKVNVTSGSATAAAPVSVTVTATPGSLPQSTYTGLLTLTLSDGTVAKIPVTMTISSIPQIIRLSQTGLTLTAVAGGGVVPPQRFSVLNVGMGMMNWTAKAISQSGAKIVLTLDREMGSSEASSSDIPSVNVSANISGLSPGQYFNQIEVDSPTALNSPQYIPIVVEVLDPSQNPGPSIEPSELVFTGIAGAASPGSQNLEIYNLKGGSLNYRSQSTTADGVSWIQYLPTAAAVNGQGPTRVVVQPDTTRLGPGIQQGVLSFTFDDGSTRNVNVLAVILAPPTGSGSALKGREASELLKRAQDACDAKTLLPSLTVLGQGFEVPAGYPTGLVVDVLDDCGNPMVDGSVTVGFSDDEPELQLTGDQNGEWTATWVPFSSLSTVTLTVTARSQSPGLVKTIQVSGGTRASQPNPQINSGGVVNTANYGSRQPLAPGDIISIFGSGLANGKASASSLPLGTTLAGTTAAIAGEALPLFYSSPTQVNAILPYGLQPNTAYQLFMSVGNRVSSVGEPVTIADAQPVIIQTSLGPAILDEHYQFLSNTNPAHPGSVLQIYAVGLGAVEGEVTAGTAPGIDWTVAQTSVMVGSVSASVKYSGLAPGYAGLYQVNLQLPADVTLGDEVPVVLMIAGQTGPPAQIPIR